MEGSPEKKENKKSSVIIGRQPVLEALGSGRAIDKILLQANTSGDIIQKIRQLAKQDNIPVQVVPAEKLSSISRGNHQGCIALVALIRYMDLQQVIDHVVSAGTAPLFVMLDGVTDVRNIGGIARSAVCCGAQAIIIPDKGVGALNEEAIKASAGALEKIQVCRVGSLLKAIDDLHHNGIKVLVSEMKADKLLPGVNFRDPLCIVMGSEQKGVQPYISKAADEHFTIPMSGDFNSFNVSVAAGIILYEAMMQRR
ncbi:MAG: 23S rRNA (guanosine(2251)-2'-O)-methyltransferase RlmB [Chitinophagaceae bacterium]|nr:23S rRNA (guanosine(2251)-2'-O)-methyltransferase RlmB [Chitinophagaceae bacterium]